MRNSIRIVTVGFIASAAMLSAGPAHATVHEIVASWCSQNGPAHPPGISGGSHADNFAQPLFASGFIGDPVCPASTRPSPLRSTRRATSQRAC